MYVFGELLDVENVKALAGTAQSASLELLKCFAYGTWKDYRAAAGALPALSAGQAAKLKKLSVVTLASRAKTIAYAALMRELEMSNVREVEDLIIECFNGELLQGKIDQRAQQRPLVRGHAGSERLGHDRGRGVPASALELGHGLAHGGLAKGRRDRRRADGRHCGAAST